MESLGGPLNNHRHPAGLLVGTPIGGSAILPVAWCAGIALVGYLWARRLYNRLPAR
jgi:ABC-2 type transport system permease protein